jgi:uncharacterized membrane protein YhhN
VVVTGAIVFTVACAAAVAGLLVAERAAAGPARALCKTGASAAFVATALALGATGSPYGRLVLAALLLGALGDVLLLSRRDRAFLGGLLAFLASHVVFAAAFLQAGVSPVALAWAGAAAAAAGVAAQRWLRPHLGAKDRVPVGAYLVVVLAMAVVAMGHAAARGTWSVALAGVVFALSDLAVARDRFVTSAFVNRAWGLPAYYAAQLVFAWSVRPPAAG